MTLKQIINKSLLLEVAGQKGLNIETLKSYLKEVEIKLKNNKVYLEDFYIQYPNLNIFIKRTFEMYNRVLQNGYERNNSQNNFEKTIKPILTNFYNSL